MLTEDTAKALTEALNRFSDVLEDSRDSISELAFQLEMYDTSEFTEALNHHAKILDSK